MDISKNRGLENPAAASQLFNLPANPVDNPSAYLPLNAVMTIVRHFAGHDWYPAEISLQTRRQPGQRILDQFHHTQLLTGQSQTGIAFSSSLLRLSVIQYRAEKVDDITRESPAATATSWDFPTSLQAIVRSYLYDGYPDIHLAAKITGYSVRTIQRRLKEGYLARTHPVLCSFFS